MTRFLYDGFNNFILKMYSGNQLQLFIRITLFMADKEATIFK